MITFIVSVFASLAILFAPVSAPVEAPSQAPEQAVEQVSQVLMTDAWQTLDDSHIHVQEDSTDVMMLEYVDSVDVYPTDLIAGQFVLTSIDLPNTYHVFHWTTIVKA